MDVHTHIHAHTRTHTYMHTHAHTHTHVHAYTHIHIHLDDAKTLTANELSVFYKQFLDEKFQDHMEYSKLVACWKVWSLSFYGI